MFEHSETVILDGKEYPIRCDINVLVEIQEQYGNLNEFEMRIAGLRITKNPDGSVITDKDNKVVFERTEPSIKAIRDALTYMLKKCLRQSTAAEFGCTGCDVAGIKKRTDFINKYDGFIGRVKYILYTP